MKTERITVNTNGSKTKDLLLRHPNFVAKSVDASFEPPPLACEASPKLSLGTIYKKISLANIHSPGFNYNNNTQMVGSKGLEPSTSRM
jgi:hypothetical protein